ncbi:Coproporphyrinogen-III oxidase [Gnomoniopsis sp. IMI 355080]|nr:Coproporphyrinogen-III oxidase [Gnomoniopsis sp. IMI 355080]
MSAPSSSLPTPRQLLTSILKSISEIPPPLAMPDTLTTRPDTLWGRSNQRSSTSSSNPFKHLHPSHRPLFTTLHVLFPSLLLPALDLLDRGLVTRLVQLSDQRPREYGDVEMADEGSTVQQGRRSSSSSSSTPASSTVYLVRSAQKPTGRRPEAAASQTVYISHTAAWNCTCAAFAFAAFPPAASALSTRTSRGEADDEWGFGGMSFDGLDESEGGVPPCCKHLLACVLAEKWVVLGDYLNERSLGKEELAGIIADV